jgi:hypothetical protein
VKSFFDVIIILTCFTILSLSYYLLKRWFSSYRKKRTEKSYSNIINNERRAQNRRSLQVALAEMKMDQAYWAEIYIHSLDRERLRLEHKPGSDEWYFLFGKKNLNRTLQIQIEKYGDIISTDKKISGVKCFDTEKLLDCIFYFLGKIIKIDDETEIILKY